MGARERVLDVEQRHPDRLKMQLHALATRVLFDDAKRAIGVEYQSGERLYGAHPRAGSAGPGKMRQVFAAREVILAGGAFNTPQLLMLSGIGPRRDARAARHRRARRSARRREEPAGPLRSGGRQPDEASPRGRRLKGATFTSDDAQYASGRTSGTASTTPTARSSRSSRDRARTRSRRTCSSMRSSADSRATSPATRRCSRRIRTASPGSCSRRTRTTRPAR